MDLQTVLIAVLILIALNLLVVGIYIILVLKEFRNTLQKVNVVIANLNTLGSAITNPVSAAIEVVTNVVKGYKAVSSIIDSRHEREESINFKASSREE